MKRVFVVFVAMLFFGFFSNSQTPIDKLATRKTKNLLQNLHVVAQDGFLFGHQDDQAYGVGWRGVNKKSDVLATAGSYPAVHGWDIGKSLKHKMNIDSVPFDQMVGWIKVAYKRRGINTISWHLDNLTSGGDSWDKTPSVKDILPGGAKHQVFLEELDLLAEFLNQCQVGLTKTPIIFRPWHEHNGGWFWWGKGNCSEEDYRSLFQFTVSYLRDTKNIHHLLYAFSPDRSQLTLNTEVTQNYLYGYPGDEYVDIIGIDNYGDVGRTSSTTPRSEQRESFLKSLKLITAIASEKGKVAALTETGLEGVTESSWFTESILGPIETNKKEISIAWILVWRNANTVHHYAPYPGHPSEADFKNFRANPMVFFEDELKNPYRKKNPILK